MITQSGLQNSAAKLLPKRTTILAITGATLGQVSVTEIECAANQSVVGLLASGSMPTEFVYFWMLENIDLLIAKQTGGAQQHVNKGDVEDLKIMIPSPRLLERYHSLAKPIFDQISLNCFGSATLANSRDALLPNLLNGGNS
jgi:type I restriction enzyme S subunit